MVSTATGSNWNSFGWLILLIYSMEHCWLSEWDALKLQSPSSPYTRPVDPPGAGCRSSVKPPPSPRPAAPTTSRHREKRGRASRKARTEKMQWTRVKWINSTDPNKHGISQSRTIHHLAPLKLNLHIWTISIATTNICKHPLLRGLSVPKPASLGSTMEPQLQSTGLQRKVGIWNSKQGWTRDRFWKNVPQPATSQVLT